MTEYIINDKQLKTATEAYVEHGLSLPITDVFISGDKLPEIVRCRDCKHYMDYEHEYEPNLGYCRFHDMEEVRDSQFCSWAERREP